MTDVTQILSQIQQGDPGAAAQLLPLVYDELRQLAAQKLAHEKPGQTLQATALVHEAYIRLVDTGQFSDVDYQSIGGLEVAAARNSYSFRSEYFTAKWERAENGDPKFKGYYFQGNWAITGETFKYSQGKFLRIRPEKRYGAFEIAARYSYIDLDDLDVSGGSQTNISIALNWYSPGNQLRIQGTLIHVDPDSSVSTENSLVAQVRAQIHW